MNFIKKYIFILFLGMMVSTTSCDRTLEELNVNPNNPPDAPIELILPSAQGYTAISVTGTDLAWYSSLFIQHTAGVWNQMFDTDRLILSNDLVNNTWSFGLYPGALMDLKVLKDKATEQEAWEYVGIAKILSAYNFGLATDLWGRVPFSEALQPLDISQPRFDNQEDIYSAIQEMLTEAIEDLQKENTVPVFGDLLYTDEKIGGAANRAAAWTKAAYALKARFHNHLSKRDPMGSAQAALEALNAGGFTSSTDDLALTDFSTETTAQNPWFQFENDRTQHAISKSMVDRLINLNDPRLPFFADSIGGEFIGAPNGSATQDQTGVLYSRPYTSIEANSPIPLMTYVEQKFIEAEANFRLGNTSLANDAYEVAVLEALNKAGVTVDSVTTMYTDQETVFPGATDLTLEHIMTQKHISQYLLEPIEAYNDWRRTGIPALSNPRGEIPRRFPYPTDEADFNGANLPATTVNNGVWWDDGTED